MRAYSPDLRLKALDAVDRGVPREEVARVVGVSVPSIKRYLKQRRETGSVAPRPHPGRPAPKGDALRAWLPGRLAAHRDATLAEHAAAFAAETGLAVSAASVSRAVSRLGWTRKKRR